jgi:zinc protease
MHTLFNRWFTGAVFVLTLAGCSTTRHLKAPAEEFPLIGQYQAKRFILKNGLRLVVVENHDSPTFAYQTWFNVGARHEEVGRTGLAHLFEHMMFKGTKNHPDGELDRLMTQAGVKGLNAFTSNDYTAYIQELPKEGLSLIIDLESDRMTHLVVDDKVFSTEREVVQNERRYREENSPEGTLYNELFATAYKTHPYHWPVIGYEADLVSMTAQDARNFYERFYSPDRATIVVVGDVDADAVFRKVVSAYGAIPARGTIDPIYLPEPDQKAQRRKRLSLRIENEKLWLAYKIPEATDPDTSVLEVIQTLLSDLRGSRLNKALVESGISSSVSSGNLELKDPGLFIVETSLQKGRRASMAEPIIVRELRRLATVSVPEAELIKAKNTLEARFVNRLDSHSGIAHFLGKTETLYGHSRFALEQFKKIQAVTPEDIKRVAKGIFKDSTLTVLTGVPK